MGRGSSKRTGWKLKCLGAFLGIAALAMVGTSGYYAFRSLKEGAYLLSFVYSLFGYYPAIYGSAAYSFFC